MAQQSHSSGQGKTSAEDQGTAVVNELAGELGRLARLLEAADDTASMLDELVAEAVRLVPGVDDASLSVVLARQRMESRHATSELPARVDEIQTETGQGPCLDAIFEQQTVRVADLGTEQRWPEFSRRAFAAGAGGMLAFQLFVEGDNLGALNLFSRQPGVFDDESEQVGLLFASHAAVAFAGALKIDSLTEAVSTRDLIGQAKGMLMERYDLDADQAFRVLVRASQHSHTKLRDVAAELVTTRRLAALHDVGPPPG